MERGVKPNSAIEVDVVVVGGGPAGASAAIQTAAAGLRVMLLDRERQGRDRPGETLHPGAEPLFTLLGLKEAIHSAGFVRHKGHWVNWSGALRFEPFGGEPHEPWEGYQVWRSDFDDILVKRASQVGATIRRRCHVTKPLIEDRRVVGVNTSEGNIRASVVIDAAGGRHWLARRLKLPLMKASPKLVVRYGYARGVTHEFEHLPALIAHEHGWTWTAPVKSSLIAWSKLDIKDHSVDPEWLPESLRGLEPSGRMRACDVTWRMAEAPAGPGYFMVGDAASVLDPASSHGILKAMMSGIMAAHLIIERARQRIDESMASETYNRWVRNWFEHDTVRLSQLYSIFSDGTGWPSVSASTAS